VHAAKGCHTLKLKATDKVLGVPKELASSFTCGSSESTVGTGTAETPSSSAKLAGSPGCLPCSGLGAAGPPAAALSVVRRIGAPGLPRAVSMDGDGMGGAGKTCRKRQAIGVCRRHCRRNATSGCWARARLSAGAWAGRPLQQGQRVGIPVRISPIHCLGSVDLPARHVGSLCDGPSPCPSSPSSSPRRRRLCCWTN
jgi:hypothetical protein